MGRHFPSWAFVLLTCTASAAQDAQRPACAPPSDPPYAAPGAQPNVKVWHEQKRAARLAPGCLRSASAEFETAVALAGAFRFEGDADKLLEHIGAVSRMRGIQYWSVTDDKWRELVTQSAALDSADAARRRRDFSAAEMKRGADLHFVQRDSRSTGEVVYRMRVLEADKDRLVVVTKNVSPVRAYFLTAFKPGELHVVHFLTRQSPNEWKYYQLTLIGPSESERNARSLVNRAAALYRYVAGQPTDRDPPLAAR